MLNTIGTQRKGVNKGEMEKPRLALIWQVDAGMWEYEWICSLLDDFEVEHVMDLQHEACQDGAVIVTSGEAKNGIGVEDYAQRFRQAGYRFGVFHLSDEYETSPVSFYRYADFVFRNYYRRDVMDVPNVRYMALGYKSGFTDSLKVSSISDRPYTWSFAGDPNKSSRAVMMEQAQRIPGGKHFHTTRFDDPNALSTHQYAELLNNTVFALCPRGNRSVDCFRVYEALEAGAIPIVEDDSGAGIWREIAHPKRFIQSGALHPRYWRWNGKRYFGRSYWLDAYGPDFPCPRIYHWENLTSILEKMDVEATSHRVRTWWSAYKQALHAGVEQAVRDKLL